MKAILKILCLMFILLLITGCEPASTIDSNSDKKKVSVSDISKIDHDSTKNFYYNQDINRYEIVDGYSDEFVEIFGEKITFEGNYEEISGPLDERLLFNAVRFYMAAASKDMSTIEKMADKELSSEIQKIVNQSINESSKYGGDVVTSFKDLSTYKKPISISTPKKIDDNKYSIKMKYCNDNIKNSVDAVLILKSNDDIRVYSFLKK